MKALTSEWFTEHRRRIACWHEDRLDDALEDIATMQHEIQQLQQEIAGRPASVHVTATDQEGQPMTSFAPGATITLTAVSDNAENVPVADTYTWTTTAGTISAGPDSTTATLVNAPLGDVTITATDPAGLVGTLTVTIADQTPATITITAA